jgi:hypothetical protein
VFASDDADWVAGKDIPEPLVEGVALPIPIVVGNVVLCPVSIVKPTEPLLEASCNTPEVSALMFSAVELVVPADTIDAILFP